MKKDLLKKFISNQCPYEECESMARFLEENEHALDKFDLFEDLLEEELIGIPQEEKDRLYNLLLPKSNNFVLIKRLLLAASIIIVFAISFFALRENENSIKNTPLTWVDIVNTKDFVQTYVLPDSSRVILDPSAHIAFRNDFAEDREIMQKEGGVTYSVFPNQEKPFRVINGRIQTRAVGTMFKISRFNRENLMVKLLEGKIVVEDYYKKHTEQVFLNNQGTLIINVANFSHKLISEDNYSTKKYWEANSIEGENSNSSIVWSNRLVEFKGVSNMDLFSVMERLFNISITVDNAAVNKGNFTGKLYQDDNLEDLLKNFCEINGCTYIIQDNKIRIK